MTTRPLGTYPTVPQPVDQISAREAQSLPDSPAPDLFELCEIWRELDFSTDTDTDTEPAEAS